MSVDLLLLKNTLRNVRQPGRLFLALPLAVIPALLALLWRTLAGARFEADVAYNALTGAVVLFTLVLLAAVFTTGVVTDETEGRTISFLLTRPVARARILFARFLGAVIAVTLTVWLSTLLLAAVSWGPAGVFRAAVGRDLLALPLGVLAYGSLFLLTATLLPRPLIFALFYAFGWETWVPFLAGSFRNLSILTYLRAIAPHPNPMQDESGQGNFFEALNPKSVPASFAGILLALVVVVALGAALVTFSLREYVPRDDAE